MPRYRWYNPALYHVAIDDHPFDALEKQFQMEDLSVSPVGKAILSVAEKLPLGWPLDKIVEGLKNHLAQDSHDRMRLMLETCMNELRRHDTEISQLRERMDTAERQAREETVGGLMLDAAQKAENTRSEERVKHIGLILANVIVEPRPADGDEVEEMMRVAMELGDKDIWYLRQLIGIQGSMLSRQDHIPRFQAHQSWEHGPWGNKVDPEIDSVFSKLEGYGLVARIPPPNNLNISADFQNRSVLLKKGARFAALIRDASSSRS